MIKMAIFRSFLSIHLSNHIVFTILKPIYRTVFIEPQKTDSFLSIETVRAIYQLPPGGVTAQGKVLVRWSGKGICPDSPM